MKKIVLTLLSLLMFPLLVVAQSGKWEEMTINKPLGVSHDYLYLSCYNERNCLIVGNLVEQYSVNDERNGVTDLFLRTTDGGETWVTQTTEHPKYKFRNKSALLRKVKMIDSLRAVAVGDSGRIITTNDGGTTWIERDSKTKWRLNDIAFYDSNNGIAVGYSGTYRITSDGGVTWQEKPELTLEAGFKDVEAPAPHTYYIFDYGYTKMLRTYNDGVTWDTIVIFKNNLLNSTTNIKVVNCASFSDSMNGWIAGTEYSSFSNFTISPYIARTEDGGIKWQVVYFKDNTLSQDDLFGVFDLEDVFNVSPKNCIAVGRVNAVLQTEDEGSTWTREKFADTTKQQILTSVVTLNKTSAIAVGVNGKLFRRQYPTSDVTSKLDEGFNQYFWITTMPIPASSSMEVTLYGLFSVKNALLSVKVYNIMGVEVADYSTAANAGNDGTISRFTADVSKLSGGVYVLRYSAGGFTKSGLFVVTR